MQKSICFCGSWQIFKNWVSPNSYGMKNVLLGEERRGKERQREMLGKISEVMYLVPQRDYIPVGLFDN